MIVPIPSINLPHTPSPKNICPVIIKIPYTPDFVRLAESYGIKGIRVENESEIDAAFEEAKSNKKMPTIIEFIIASDELVLPMVKPGKPVNDMIIN